VSSPDGLTHNARTCPLRQTKCRRSLHEGHPFIQPGHCVSAGCVHKQKCNTCGITGHLYGTQELTTRRWKRNKNGGLVRTQTSEALKKEDFVCTLLTELSVKSMVDNSVSVSTAAAQDAHTRRMATSRLRGNGNAERLGIDETVRAMEGLGSVAALLQGQNHKGFKTLYANAHLGAVEANRLAASAAESSLDEATPPPSNGEEKDLLSTPGVDGASPWSKGGGSANGLAQGGGPGVGSRGRSNGGSGFGGRSSSERPKQQEKSERRLLAGRQSRTARYAAAVAKSQARSSRKSVGQKPGKRKGKALRAGAALASSEPIDVNAAADGPYLKDWPLNTRARFEINLPVFFSPRFAGNPPLRIAHAVVSELYQCPLKEVDSDMAGIVVKGAIDSQVRGSTLTLGTLCAAQVAEWLCAAMTQALSLRNTYKHGSCHCECCGGGGSSSCKGLGGQRSRNRCTCSCRTCRSCWAVGGGRCPSGCPGGIVTGTSGFGVPAVPRVRPATHFQCLIALFLVVGSALVSRLYCRGGSLAGKAWGRGVMRIRGGFQRTEVEEIYAVRIKMQCSGY